MNLWIVLFSILLPVQPQTTQTGIDDAQPLRYRGIEQLLAKFEAEAQR